MQRHHCKGAGPKTQEIRNKMCLSTPWPGQLGDLRSEHQLVLQKNYLDARLPALHIRFED